MVDDDIALDGIVALVVGCIVELCLASADDQSVQVGELPEHLPHHQSNAVLGEGFAYVYLAFVVKNTVGIHLHESFRQHDHIEHAIYIQVCFVRLCVLFLYSIALAHHPFIFVASHGHYVRAKHCPVNAELRGIKKEKHFGIVAIGT